MPRLPFKLALPAVHQALSDTDLIAACLKGEQTAWDSLIGRYIALIYSVCIKTGLSGADAEDVAQDVCVILIDHLGDLRDNAKLSSWLISTTRREAWRFQRRKGMTPATDLGDGEWAMEAAEAVHAPAADTPEAAFLALEEQQIVRLGLEKLPDRCRRMLTLLYGVEEPPSYTEIAAEFSIPVGSIGPTRARCLQQLKKLLAQEGF